MPHRSSHAMLTFVLILSLTSLVCGYHCPDFDADDCSEPASSFILESQPYSYSKSYEFQDYYNAMFIFSVYNTTKEGDFYVFPVPQGDCLYAIFLPYFSDPSITESFRISIESNVCTGNHYRLYNRVLNYTEFIQIATEITVQSYTTPPQSVKYFKLVNSHDIRFVEASRVLISFDTSCTYDLYRMCVGPQVYWDSTTQPSPGTSPTTHTCLAGLDGGLDTMQCLCSDKSSGPLCDQVRCQNYEGCSECVADRACSFCPSNGRCYDGALENSPQAPCEDDALYYGECPITLPYHRESLINGGSQLTTRWLAGQGSVYCHGELWVFGGMGISNGVPLRDAWVYNFDWGWSQVTTSNWLEWFDSSNFDTSSIEALESLLRGRESPLVTCVADHFLVVYGGGGGGNDNGDSPVEDDVFTLDLWSGTIAHVLKNCFGLDWQDDEVPSHCFTSLTAGSACLSSATNVTRYGENCSLVPPPVTAGLLVPFDEFPGSLPVGVNGNGPGVFLVGGVYQIDPTATDYEGYAHSSGVWVLLFANASCAEGQWFRLSGVEYEGRFPRAEYSSSLATLFVHNGLRTAGSLASYVPLSTFSVPGDLSQPLTLAVRWSWVDSLAVPVQEVLSNPVTFKTNHIGWQSVLVSSVLIRDVVYVYGGAQPQILSSLTNAVRRAFVWAVDLETFAVRALDWTSDNAVGGSAFAVPRPHWDRPLMYVLFGRSLLNNANVAALKKIDKNAVVFAPHINELTSIPVTAPAGRTDVRPRILAATALIGLEDNNPHLLVVGGLTSPFSANIIGTAESWSFPPPTLMTVSLTSGAVEVEDLPSDMGCMAGAAYVANDTALTLYGGLRRESPGSPLPNLSSAIVAAKWTYTYESGEWTTSPINGLVSLFGCAGQIGDDVIMLTGLRPTGEGLDFNSTSSIIRILPDNTWEALYSLETGWFLVSCLVEDDKLLIFGGVSAQWTEGEFRMTSGGLVVVELHESDGDGVSAVVTSHPNSVPPAGSHHGTGLLRVGHVLLTHLCVLGNSNHASGLGTLIGLRSTYAEEVSSIEHYTIATGLDTIMPSTCFTVMAGTPDYAVFWSDEGYDTAGSLYFWRDGIDVYPVDKDDPENPDWRIHTSGGVGRTISGSFPIEMTTRKVSAIVNETIEVVVSDASEDSMTLNVPATDTQGTVPVSVMVTSVASLSRGYTTVRQIASSYLEFHYVGCPEGEMAATPLTPCSKCPAGQVVAPDATSCVTCSGGTYTDLPGQTECFTCRAGAVALEPTACLDCEPGYFSATENALVACSPCPRGTYQADGGSSACMPCPANATSDLASESEDACLCNIGFYGTYESGCIECDLTTSVCSSVGQELPEPKPGYWRDADNNMLECLPAIACPGGADNLCAAEFTGERCSSCAINHYPLQSTCVPCPDDSTSRLILLSFVVLLVLVMVIVMANRMGSSGGVSAPVGIAVSFVQLTAVFGSLRLSWPKEIQAIFSVFSVLNMNVDVASPECAGTITYYNKFVFILLLPLAFLVLYFVFYVMSVGYRLICRCLPQTLHELAVTIPFLVTNFKVFAPLTKEMHTSIRAAFFHGFLLLLSLCYVFLTGKSFEYLTCFDAGDDFYLVAAPSISCTSKQYKAVLPLAYITLIVYGLGIPLLFGGILLLRHKKLMAAKRFSDFTLYYGFLTVRYEHDYFWWELAVFARKAGVLASTIFFARIPVLQGLSAMVVMLVALLAQVYARPFIHKKDDNLEVVTLMCDFVILFCGLLFVSGALVDESGEPTVSYFFMTWMAVSMFILSFASIALYLAIEIRLFLLTYRHRKYAHHDENEALIHAAEETLSGAGQAMLLRWLATASAADRQHLEDLLTEVAAKAKTDFLHPAHKGVVRSNVRNFVQGYLETAPEEHAEFLTVLLAEMATAKSRGADAVTPARLVSGPDGTVPAATSIVAVNGGTLVEGPGHDDDSSSSRGSELSSTPSRQGAVGGGGGGPGDPWTKRRLSTYNPNAGGEVGLVGNEVSLRAVALVSDHDDESDGSIDGHHQERGTPMVAISTGRRGSSAVGAPSSGSGEAGAGGAGGGGGGGGAGAGGGGGGAAAGGGGGLQEEGRRASVAISPFAIPSPSPSPAKASGASPPLNPFMTKASSASVPAAVTAPVVAPRQVSVLPPLGGPPGGLRTNMIADKKGGRGGSNSSSLSGGSSSSVDDFAAHSHGVRGGESEPLTAVTSGGGYRTVKALSVDSDEDDFMVAGH